MNILKFMSGFLMVSIGITWTINAVIRYPLNYKDLPEATLTLILLSMLSLGFGLWAIGDSLEK